MNDPMAAGIILRALAARDEELLLDAVQTLSNLTQLVPWGTFLSLLGHPRADVRVEAAFALARRHARKAARHLLAAIRREHDAKTRRTLLRYLGMLPEPKLLLPLMRIALCDGDQKARLAATRALDRLQALLPRTALFRLRRVRDLELRAEVLYRLGKFGTEDERYKNWLRHQAEQSRETLIIQAALEGLGAIADHDDLELFERHLKDDPLTAYLAGLALTRCFRMGDVSRALAVLEAARSTLLQQTFLKFLIRRRGLGADALTLLSAVQRLLVSETNMSVRYLAFNLLASAPCEATVTFLIEATSTARDAHEHLAIARALGQVAAHHAEILLPVLIRCPREAMRDLLMSLPEEMDPGLIAAIMRVVTRRIRPEEDEELQRTYCRVLEQLLAAPGVPVAVAGVLPDATWKKLFLRALVVRSGQMVIESLRKTLLDWLSDEDVELAQLAMLFIVSLGDPSVYARIVAAGEKCEVLKPMARRVVRTAVERGAL
jgi:HEAT repeat protein